MKKFEYKEVDKEAGSFWRDDFDRLGDEGWELVGFDGELAWFKREMVEED